ncbi:MAG: tyrosine-type recombinase/integrase [Propylenella sp.]
MALSDTRCRNAKRGAKRQKLSDGGGLFLLVQPSGSRLWRLAYRYDGKQKTLALGSYPVASLAAARKRRDEAKALLAGGIDPGAERKRQKAAAKISAATTFRAVADEWLAKLEREGRAPVTLSKKKWLLSLVDDDLGDRPIAELTAQGVLAAVRRIEARGRHETAQRARATIGAVCRYAVATGRAENDPTQPLRGALISPKVKHHAAITEPRAIGELMRAIDGYRGAPQVEAALKLLPFVFCRPGELRAAEWREFNLDSAVWTVPAARMKMRRPHRIPLSHQSLAILRKLDHITGDGVLVFPSIRSRQRCLSENTLNAALRRLGYGTDQMTSHGFRSMAATRLNEMCRWHPDVIERALAHQEANAVRRAYTSAVEYWPERVELMQVWADYLDELREKPRPESVLDRVD